MPDQDDGRTGTGSPAPGDDEESLWIESVRNPDGVSQCLITWGPLQFYASAADVRETALGLVTCAAYAEMMMVLSGMGMPAEHVSKFAADVLRQAGCTSLGTAATMRLLPAGSSKSQSAAVLMRRGDEPGGRTAAIPAEQARQIALQFLETAEAAESDDLLAEAMSATGVPGDSIDSVFGYLRGLRTLAAGESGR